jgi:hypothetical protein
VSGPPTGDTGEADPRLAAALHRWQQAPGPARRAEVLAALVDARVFVCVAARASGAGVEMALLSVVRTDGARVLPVFSDGHAVQRWRREARPVPVTAPQACLAARDAGADGLLLDPPGAALGVHAAEAATLARGWVPVIGTPLASRRTTVALTAPSVPASAALVQALGAALRAEPVRSARLLQGPDGLVLGLDAALDAAALAALAARVRQRLGAALPPDGLDVAVVGPRPDGQPVPVPRAWRWRR